MTIEQLKQTTPYRAQDDALPDQGAVMLFYAIGVTVAHWEFYTEEAAQAAAAAKVINKEENEDLLFYQETSTIREAAEPFTSSIYNAPIFLIPQYEAYWYSAIDQNADWTTTDTAHGYLSYGLSEFVAAGTVVKVTDYIVNISIGYAPVYRHGFTPGMMLVPLLAAGVLTSILTAANGAGVSSLSLLRKCQNNY